MWRLAILMSALVLGHAGRAAAQTTVQGMSETGAAYWIVVPADWNQDLVLLLHGYTDPVVPVGTHPNIINDLRDALVPLGYAVAYSAWSKNGWAVHEGVVDTHALRGIFVDMFGQPRFTYVAGKSLGGITGLKLAQQHGSIYDGLYSLCGLLGGSQPMIDRVVHIRALFDYFYPGVMPGSLTEPPGYMSQQQVLAIVRPAVLANPAPALELARVAQSQLTGQADTIGEIITSLTFNLWSHGRGIPEIVERAGGWPAGNIDTVYTGSSDDAALNAGVARVSSSKQGANYLDKYYFPNDWLGFPVVSLHNVRDPAAVSTNQAMFAAIIKDDVNVVYRQTPNFGHCSFTPAELVANFQLLTSWVETGIRPEPFTGDDEDDYDR
jgi:hypothetical protein